MAVIDGAAAGVRAARRGATLLLLRMPDAGALAQYQELTALVGASPLPVLIRGRPDLALATGAAGVNLPEADISVAAARSLLGPDRLIGRSVHSLAAASLAAAEGADFVVFGPVFPTSTHPGAAGFGVIALGDVARAVTIPVLAIGGVDAERAAECLAAGASGFAAIRLFRDDPTP
ncbi:MAG: thiamine phosphate synthase [Candidatus Dormibacteraeota bacterium]|nr:thiamine phosphate synthase [Candidatus Dormibacteraeota bacterium]